MDRFGSNRFRMVWVFGCLLLAGLVLGGVQGFNKDGTDLLVFGASIPLGFEQARPTVEQSLGRVVYTLVPATLLLAGFLPVSDWVASGARGERLKGLFQGMGLALVHGALLGQALMLPVLAASYRLLGNPFAGSVMRSDLNGFLLGVQLLFWAVALALVVKSNRGIALLLAYALGSCGKLLAWVGEFGQDLDLPRKVIQAAVFLGRLLPAEILPTDPTPWKALPYALGGPFLLALLLSLLPSKGGAKRSKG